MVELHDADRIGLPAAGTGKLPQPPQQVHLLAPATVPLFAATCYPRIAGRPARPEAPCDQTTQRLALGANAVTIGADDIAFRGFRDQQLARLVQHLVRAEREQLRARVTVIEVHDPRGKCPAAVRTRPSPEIPQELERRRLPDANALDLLLAMGGVIRDVVRTLIATRSHIRS
jgi:hypothetical protein